MQATQEMAEARRNIQGASPALTCAIRTAAMDGSDPVAVDSPCERGGRAFEMGAQKGDAAFLSWMRSYIKNFTYKTGETRHLVGILNQMTGKDWQPWFERYVYGTEMPKVK